MEENKNKILNVPTLRFDGFVDNWTIATLGDVCSYRKERRTLEKKYYVSTENILQNYQGIERFDSIDKISGEAFDKNDVLMGNIRPYLKKVCFADFDGVCNADVLVFKSKALNPKYLHCVLANDSFINYVMSSVKGSKMPRGDKNYIMQYPLSYPSELEQAKISNFIEILTKRIAVQNKIISKYETLIKGISNHLLCKIEDCPTIKLSDILIEYNDKARQNNEYPILSSTMNGIFVQSEYFNKQAASEETVGYKKVPYGYCTYRSMSDTGEFRFNIQKIVEIGIVSPAYPVFTSVEYDMRFIAFYLNNSARLRKQILEIKEGGTRFALPFSKLRSLTIPKITRLQQTKIVDVYCLFSRKKELEQRFLLKLKEQKDYLLSKMFI